MSDSPVDGNTQALPVRKVQQNFAAQLALVGFVGLAGIAALMGQPMLCDLCIAEVFFIGNQILKRPPSHAKALHEDIIELEASLPPDAQALADSENLQKETVEPTHESKKVAEKEKPVEAPEDGIRFTHQRSESAATDGRAQFEGEMAEISNTKTHVIEKATEHVLPSTTIDREDDKTTDTESGSDTCESVPVTLPRTRRDSPRPRSLRIETSEAILAVTEVKRRSLVDIPSPSVVSSTPVPAILLTPPMSPDLVPGGYTMQLGEASAESDHEADVHTLLYDITRPIQEAEAEDVNHLAGSLPDSPLEDYDPERGLEEAFAREFSAQLTAIEVMMTGDIAEAEQISRKSSVADSVSADCVIIEKADVEFEEGKDWENQHTLHTQQDLDVPVQEFEVPVSESAPPQDETVSVSAHSTSVPPPPELIVVTAENEDVKIVFPIIPNVDLKEDEQVRHQESQPTSNAPVQVKTEEPAAELADPAAKYNVLFVDPFLSSEEDRNINQAEHLVDTPPSSPKATGLQNDDGLDPALDGSLLDIHEGQNEEMQFQTESDETEAEKHSPAEDAISDPQSSAPEPDMKELNCAVVSFLETTTAETVRSEWRSSEPELAIEAPSTTIVEAAESPVLGRALDEELAPDPSSSRAFSDTSIPVENATVIDRIKHLRRNRSDSMGTMDNYSNIYPQDRKSREVVSAIKTPSLSSLRSKSSKKVTFALEEAQIRKDDIAEATESIASSNDEEALYKDDSERLQTDKLEMVSSDTFVDASLSSIATLPLSTPIDSLLNAPTANAVVLEQEVDTMPVEGAIVQDSEVGKGDDAASKVSSESQYPVLPEQGSSIEPIPAAADVQAVETADVNSVGPANVGVEFGETRPTSSHSEARSSMTTESGKKKRWTFIRSLSTRFKSPRNSQPNTPTSSTLDSNESNLPVLPQHNPILQVVNTKSTSIRFLRKLSPTPLVTGLASRAKFHLSETRLAVLSTGAARKVWGFVKFLITGYSSNADARSGGRHATVTQYGSFRGIKKHRSWIQDVESGMHEGNIRVPEPVSPKKQKTEQGRGHQYRYHKVGSELESLFEPTVGESYDASGKQIQFSVQNLNEVVKLAVASASAKSKRGVPL